MTGGFFKQTVRDVPLDHQTVLVRVDYNVPLNDDGTIADDLRIKASFPTLEYLLGRGCKLVLIAHMGRPEGRDPKLSLEPAAERLAKLMRRDVRFVDDCIGDKVAQAIKRAPSGSIIVLENLRFYKQEEADDEEFAKHLAHASQARYFVQDGFGVVHRAHASTHAITLFLPSVAGFLVEKEFMTITRAMHAPVRPLVAVLGGAKVSDKIGVVQEFAEKADQIIIGGAMANTFLAYQGFKMGASDVEAGQKKVIDGIYEAVKKRDKKELIILPSDLAVGKKVDPSEPRRIVARGELASDDIALDSGDDSIEQMVAAVQKAGTVIWSGTLGVAELPNFAHGSARLALTLATHPDITSIIGGGDTADFVNHWDSKDGKSFSWVSTGGSASLDLMAGEKLPGVESLLDARR